MPELEMESILETSWFGMDTTSDPVNLPQGMLQLLQDGVIVAGREGSGGNIKTRPGSRAQLTSALSGAVTAIHRYKDNAAGECCLIAVASTTGAVTATTTGYLYRWIKGGTTANQLTAIGTFYVANVQFAGISGGSKDYVIAIGHTSGAPQRIDLTLLGTDGTGAVTASLTNPTTAPSVSLTRTNIDTTANNVGGNWAADTNSGGGAVPDIIAGGNSLNSAAWTLTGVEAVNIFLSTYGVRFDSSDDKATLITPPANASLANTYYSPATTRYCTHFRFTGTWYTDSGGAADSIIVTVTARTASTELARQSFTFTPGIVLTSAAIAHVFDFSYLDNTLVTNFSCEISTPGTRPGNNGPYLYNVSVVPYAPSLSIANSTTVAGAVAVTQAPNADAVTAILEQRTLFWGGLRLTHAVTGVATATDLSGYTTIAIPISLGAPLDNVRVRLCLRKSTSDTGAFTDVMTVAQTAAGQRYLFADISSLSATQRGSGGTLTHIDMVFQGDVAVTAGSVSVNPILTISPFSNSGGLAIGLPYIVRFTEATTYNVASTRVESGGSPLSTTLVPDGLNATMKVTFPALANASANGRGVYVEGGTFGDAYFRLIGNTYLASGSGTPASGTGFTWDGTTLTYSGPDGAVLVSSYYQDADPAPTSPQAVAAYHNRIVYGVGRDIYISRLETGAATALRFNLVNNVNAPDFAVQGLYTPVGSGEGGSTVGEKILRMVTYRSRCILFFGSRIYILSGLNLNNFEVREYQSEKLDGIVAPNAFTIADNRLFWLGSTGLMAFDGSGIDRDYARPIAGLLSPSTEYTGLSLNPTSLAQASMVAHAGRIFLNAPTASSGSSIAATYCWDIRAGGYWSVWNLGKVLAMASFAGSADGTDDLIIGTGDTYQLCAIGSNYGDTTTAAGTVNPVTLSVKTREVSGTAYNLLATRFSFTATCQDATTAFNWGVYGDDATANAHTGVWTLNAPGEVSIKPIKMRGNVHGRELYLTFNATTVNPVLIDRLELTAVKSKRI